MSSESRFVWSRVSVSMMDNRKIVKLCDRGGPAAVLYYLASIFYAKAMDSAGQISRRAIASVPMPLDVSLKDRQAYVRLLLELNLWEEITPDVYVIHNWHRYQTNRETAGSGRYTSYEDDGYSTVSTPQWITSERLSGSEVSERDYKSLSPLLSSPNRFTKDARGPDTGARAQPRDAPTREREAPLRCRECSLPHGYHLEDCSLRFGPVGLGTFPDTSPRSGEREGPEKRCPSCGVGWGLGHAEDCSYDSKRPLLTRADSGSSVPSAMDNSGRARDLRERLRSGSLHDDEHGSPHEDER